MYLNYKFWGLKGNNNIIIDRPILKQILEKCGRYVVYVDFAKSDVYQRHTYRAQFRIQSCKNVFAMIRDTCPNINSIDAGNPCGPDVIDYIANNFKSLIFFKADELTEIYDKPLTNLFTNNQSLQHLKLDNTYINNSLSSLNFTLLQELSLSGCTILSLKDFLTASHYYNNYIRETFK